MLRFFSKVQDAQVISLQGGERIGKVDDLFIDYDTGKIIGLYVKVPRFIFSDIKVLLSPNIVEWSNAVYIQTPDAVTEPQELVRFKKKIEDDFSIFGLKTFSKKKQYLGRVDDVMIETVTMTLRKLQITQKSLLNNNELLVPMANVHKITSQEVIVNDIRGKVHLRIQKRDKATALD